LWEPRGPGRQTSSPGQPPQASVAGDAAALVAADGRGVALGALVGFGVFFAVGCFVGFGVVGCFVGLCVFFGFFVGLSVGVGPSASAPTSTSARSRVARI
jgi:hypothetical protein